MLWLLEYDFFVRYYMYIDILLSLLFVDMRDHMRDIRESADTENVPPPPFYPLPPWGQGMSFTDSYTSKHFWSCVVKTFIKNMRVMLNMKIFLIKNKSSVLYDTDKECLSVCLCRKNRRASPSSCSPVCISAPQQYTNGHKYFIQASLVVRVIVINQESCVTEKKKSVNTRNR